jgi:hypothetical protein
VDNPMTPILSPLLSVYILEFFCRGKGLVVPSTSLRLAVNSTVSLFLDPIKLLRKVGPSSN